MFVANDRKSTMGIKPVVFWSSSQKAGLKTHDCETWTVKYVEDVKFEISLG